MMILDGEEEIVAEEAIVADESEEVA